MNVRRISVSAVIVFAAAAACFVTTVPAQRLRLRSNINPHCTRPDGSSTDFKFADIYADGNIAVQGTYSCRGVFIYDLTNPDAPVAGLPLQSR